MNSKIEVLKKCTVEGNLVRLPDYQLDKKVYTDVAKALQLIGGKWKGGKVQAFVFNDDPTELLAEIAGGEKRNLKKEFQFFATPDSLADYLVELACIKLEHDILEPSAGQGAIVNAINRKLVHKKVDCYELMPVNQIFLKKIMEVELIGEDFLEQNNGKLYDRIIANPPFSKNQDIDHIKEMYSRLKKGGILVSIASKHWEASTNKKEVQFKSFLDDNQAEVLDIESGTFQASGTMVGAKIIILTKS